MRSVTPLARHPVPGLATVLLAAGGSSRLGRPKQLVRFRGQPLLRRAVDAAAAATAGPIIVVVGAEGTRLRALLARTPTPRVEITQHAAWHEGLSSSLRRGLEAVPASAAAVLFLLADQPLVDVRSLRRLVAAWQRRPAQAAAAAYAGQVGVPAILPRRLFRALAALRGDEGARRVLAAERRVTHVDMPEAAFDVDTPEDLKRLFRQPMPDEPVRRWRC